MHIPSPKICCIERNYCTSQRLREELYGQGMAPYPARCVAVRRHYLRPCWADGLYLISGDERFILCPDLSAEPSRLHPPPPPPPILPGCRLGCRRRGAAAAGLLKRQRLISGSAGGSEPASPSWQQLDAAEGSTTRIIPKLCGEMNIWMCSCFCYAVTVGFYNLRNVRVRERKQRIKLQLPGMGCCGKRTWKDRASQLHSWGAGRCLHHC